MNVLDIMKRQEAYASGYEHTPTEEQNRAKQLCWEYNQTAPNESEKRHDILEKLLGTCPPVLGIEPDFHCDYGFNIHIHGFAFLNYNCVILDTSPVHIGTSPYRHRAYVWLVPGMPLIQSSAVRESERLHRSP